MMLKARYVLPVDGPVIEDGCVVVAGDRIAAIGPARDVHKPPVTDYGDALICPGFINAHTHLELTSLAGRVPPTSDFIDWLRRLVAVRRAESITQEQVQQAVRTGIAQSVRAGVTAIGDITSRPAWTREVLARSPLGGVSFGEIIAIGNRRHLLAERLDAAAAWDIGSGRMRAGISPHAPYTLEPDGLRRCAERARSLNSPLCIHLAECADELLFTQSGEGPFAEYLSKLGGRDHSVPASGCRPIELAHRSGLLGPRTIAAHANYVTDADIDQLAAGGTHVAFCPRTHDAFGHPPHRFRDMLLCGVNVCIGTDSLASNPSLCVLDELRFLHRQYPDFPPEELLRMGTIRSARALGLAEQTGSLTVGKQADLVVIPLPESPQRRRCPNAVLSSILESCDGPTAVYILGKHQDFDAPQ